MKILVTGATGFIGSHLVSALVRQGKYSVSIIRRRGSNDAFPSDVDGQVKKYSLDEKDNSSIIKIVENDSPDIVIHLASLFLSSHTSDQIEPLIQSNITFSSKLLDAMVDHGIKYFINTGTLWEHYTNEADYNPVNLYAATKRAFEDVLQYYTRAYDLKACTLKFFDTYGPHDRRKKLFNVLKSGLDGKETLQFSPGEQELDLLYVDDAVNAYIKTIDYLKKKKERGHDIFFIGSGKSVRLKDVVATFEEIYDQKLKINWGGRPYRDREIMTAKADIKKAQDVLGWTPKVSLKEGLITMYQQEVEND